MVFDLHLGLRAKALITGIVCGIAGVIPDIDHIPQYLYNVRMEPIFLIHGFFDRAGTYGWSGRAIHPLLLYISLIAFTCIVGLLLQYSVRSTAKSVAKSVVTAVQKAIGQTPAVE